MPELKENVEIVLSSKFSERISTGYFLPAGVELLVRVVQGDFKGWAVRIGAHSDDLTNCSELRRWPSVTVRKILDKDKMSLNSPFGGLVFFENPNAGELQVVLTNVVEAPFIDVTKPETVLHWRRRRNSPGLW